MSRRNNSSPSKEENRAYPTPSDLPVSQSTTHQSLCHPLHPSSSSGLSDQNPSRHVPDSSQAPVAPESLLVCPFHSVSSTVHTPSTSSLPNIQAFQQALAIAQNLSLDPPDPDPSDSDHSSDYSNIFLNDNEETCLLLLPL